MFAICNNGRDPCRVGINSNNKPSEPNRQPIANLKDCSKTQFLAEVNKFDVTVTCQPCLNVGFFTPGQSKIDIAHHRGEAKFKQPRSAAGGHDSDLLWQAPPPPRGFFKSVLGLQGVYLSLAQDSDYAKSKRRQEKRG